jgi:hypothetical protein
MTPEPTDDEIMATLRRAAATVDPVPASVTEAARAALATRRLDEELAELVLDSALAAGAVRAEDDDTRVLSFRAGDVTLELQVEQGPSLRGLVLGTTDQVVLETPDGTRDVHLGTDGWFELPSVPAGPLRIRARAANGRSVVTPWVTV